MRPRSLDECDSGGGHSRVDDVILGELAIRGGELFLNETDDSMFTRLDFCECAGEWRRRRFHAFHRNRRFWSIPKPVVKPPTFRFSRGFEGCLEDSI